MGQDGVDLILEIVILGQDFAGLDLLDDIVDENEAGAVSSLNGGLAGQVDVALGVGSGLTFASEGNGSPDHLGQAVVTAGVGNGLDDGAAQSGGKSGGVDLCVLRGVDVGLVQGDDHGDAQFQQLGGEEEAAAQVGGVDDVDDDIGILAFDVGAGDALFTGEGRHRIGAGQVDGDQLLTVGAECLFDGAHLFFNGDTRPVADFFVFAGQSVEHGGFAAVGVSGQRDSHGFDSS